MQQKEDTEAFLFLVLSFLVKRDNNFLRLEQSDYEKSYLSPAGNG